MDYLGYTCLPIALLCWTCPGPSCGWLNKRSNIVLGLARGTAPASECTLWEHTVGCTRFQGRVIGGLPFEGRGWGGVFGLGVGLVSLCGRPQGPHPAVGCLRITIFILCVRRCNFIPRQFSSWTGLRSMIFHYHLRIGEVWTIRNNKSDPLPTEHIHCTEKFVPLQGKKQRHISFQELWVCCD